MTEINTPYGVEKIGRVSDLSIESANLKDVVLIIHEIMKCGDVVVVPNPWTREYLSGNKTHTYHQQYHALNAPQSKAQKELEELEKKHKEMGEAIEMLRKEMVK